MSTTQIISQSTIDLAKKIVQANKEGRELFIMKGRRSGILLATRLATDTEDIQHENIKSKLCQR